MSAFISCSIFMASIIATGLPSHTSSPSFTFKSIIRPCMGDLIAKTPSGNSKLEISIALTSFDSAFTNPFP